jgi:hypothetical protein
MALLFHGGLATTSAVLDEVYGRRPGTPRSLRSRGGAYARMRARLAELADRVCRSNSPGRPWLWQLRPQWGPPHSWDVMYDRNGEWMRDENGELILRDPDLIGVHPDHEAEFRRGGRLSMPRKSIPAIAYLRTSSTTNAGPDKDSDKRQRAAIAAFAQAHGYAIVDAFYDAAVSGSDPIGERPPSKE